jgi:hypothetical protein
MTQKHTKKELLVAHTMIMLEAKVLFLITLRWDNEVVK